MCLHDSVKQRLLGPVTIEPTTFNPPGGTGCRRVPAAAPCFFGCSGPLVAKDSRSGVPVASRGVPLAAPPDLTAPRFAR